MLLQLQKQYALLELKMVSFLQRSSRDQLDVP
jgi:hypothetical protein